MTELEIYQAAAVETLKRVVNERDEAIRLLAQTRKSLQHTAFERDWESSRRLLAEINALLDRVSPILA